MSNASIFPDSDEGLLNALAILAFLSVSILWPNSMFGMDDLDGAQLVLR